MWCFLFFGRGGRQGFFVVLETLAADHVWKELADEIDASDANVPKGIVERDLTPALPTGRRPQ